MTPAIVAVIYVPADEFDTYGLRCSESCKSRGYLLFGVTHSWDDAVEMKDNGVVDRIVVGRSDHIDQHNLPGVEVASTPDVAVDPPGQGRRSRRRRPRIV